jgi:hypothetical protein
MKRKIFLLALLTLMIFTGFHGKAQNGPVDPMSKDSWLLNFGIGPGVKYYDAYSTGFGPGFQVAFEKGMWQLGPGVLTLGAEFGVSYFWYKYSYDDADAYSYSWVSVIPAARCAYHYGWKVKGLDTYGGVATGFRFLAFSEKYYNGHNGTEYGYNPASISFFPGIFVGASYFFNDQIGINGELGYNINVAQIGMVFKLK